MYTYEQSVWIIILTSILIIIIFFAAGIYQENKHIVSEERNF